MSAIINTIANHHDDFFNPQCIIFQNQKNETMNWNRKVRLWPKPLSEQHNYHTRKSKPKLYILLAFPQSHHIRSMGSCVTKRSTENNALYMVQQRVHVRDLYWVKFWYCNIWYFVYSSAT